LLRTRNYGLFWFGESTSAVGSAITLVALPLVAVVNLHAGTVVVAMLTALNWLPWLLIGLPAGAWVDRWRHRKTLLIGDAVSGTALLGVAIAAWSHTLSVELLLASAFLTGCSGVFTSLAFQAYLPFLLAEEDLLEGNAKLQTSSAAATVGGPGLGGLLAQIAGAATGVFVDALTFLVSVACLLGIRTQPQRTPDRKGRPSVLSEVREGLRFVRHDRYLLPIACLSAMLNLSLTGISALRILFLVRTLGVAPGTAGLVIGLGSSGGLVGAVAASRTVRRFGSARTLLLADIGATPFSLLLPLSSNGWRLLLFVFGWIVVTAGLAIGNVVIGTFRGSYCPPQLLGRVSASMRFLVFGTVPISAVLAGVLGTTWGIRSALWTLASLGAVAPLLLLATPMRHARDLPARPNDDWKDPAMTNPFEVEGGTYVVLMNDERQHSLWPSSVDVPAGWAVVHPQASRRACLDYIEESWSDMRPLSLIRQMADDTTKGGGAAST
jgi:uncharacterized protein YbdZ (MbtH family)